jgi:signal transduction histidine kinase
MGHKLRDAALTQDYYQGVIDSVDSVIYTVDRDLHLVGVNRRWNEFARSNGGEHLVEEQALGTWLLDQMHGEPLARWRKVCRQILDGEIPRYLDEVASEEPFPWRHYALTASPLQNKSGEILGITFVATNITQLKRAEVEMLERLVEVRGLRQVAQAAAGQFVQRSFYRQVTADIAHLFDAERCIIFRWDRHSGHLRAQIPAYGLSEDRLADLELDVGDPADPASLWQDLEEKDFILLNEEGDLPDEMDGGSARQERLAAMMAVLRVSGRVHGTLLVASRGHPFAQRDGQLLAAFAVPVVLAIEDAELNQRLLRRSQQLASAQEELARLIKMAESMRMPATVLRGYLELLTEGALGPTPEKQLPTVTLLRDKARQVADLLDRLSAGRSVSLGKRYQLLHLSDLLSLAVERWRGAAARAGLELTVTLPASKVGRGLTTGNPDALYEVFDALLHNAVKFSPNGGAIRVSLHESDEIVYVQIDDPGVGMPTPRLLQVWQPREQSEPADTMGLAEVKRIVEEHGGQVWAESAPGQGSTFYVALPRVVKA